MNIVDRIFDSCNDTATALVSDGDEISFGELKQRTKIVAGELSPFFSDPDRKIRVAVNYPNNIDHIIASLGVLAAGGCLVPVPDELTDFERRNLVQLTGCDLVFCGEKRDWPWAPNQAPIEGTTRPSTLHFDVRNEDESLAFDEKDFAALNPALIRFSSGTTGNSKGVVLSHESLFERVTACNSRLKISPDDRVIWILPMAHHFAVSIVLYLMQGATTIVLDSHLADAVNEGIEKLHGTVIYGAPFHHQLMAEYPDGKPHPHLRLAVSTAAPLPLETAKDFRERYDIPLTQGLGIIEIGLPFLNNEFASEKPLSIGLPQNGFEWKIAGPDSEGIGELLVRGPGMFDAYLIPWTPRKDIVDSEGWFRTGDLATADDDGCITLRGRKKSVINVAGMKVFPEEVEVILNSHPDIAESRVSGLHHRVSGQIVEAHVVAADPENRPKDISVLKYCRERLSPYRVPAKLTWVEEIEKTASGKIKR